MINALKVLAIALAFPAGVMVGFLLAELAFGWTEWAKDMPKLLFWKGTDGLHRDR